MLYYLSPSFLHATSFWREGWMAVIMKMKTSIHFCKEANFMSFCMKSNFMSFCALCLHYHLLWNNTMLLHCGKSVEPYKAAISPAPLACWLCDRQIVPFCWNKNIFEDRLKPNPKIWWYLPWKWDGLWKQSSLWAPAQFKRRSVSLGDHGCCCFSVGWEWCGSPQLGVTIPCCVAVWKRSKMHLISQREQFRPWLVELILVLTGTKSLEPAPGNVSTNWCLDTEKSFSSVD